MLPRARTIAVAGLILTSLCGVGTGIGAASALPAATAGSSAAGGCPTVAATAHDPAPRSGGRGGWVAAPHRRLLDTRSDPDGGRLDAGCPRPITQAAETVPSDATAIALTVTVIAPDVDAVVTVAPCDQPDVATSDFNVSAGDIGSGFVISPLPAPSGTCVTSSAPAHLVVDLVGSFGPNGMPLAPVVAARRLDTRGGLSGGRLAAGAPRSVTLGGSWPIPRDAGAALVNVTVVDPADDGWLSVHHCGGPPPTTSTINFPTGTTRAVATIADLGPAGEICLTSSTATDVIIDVEGVAGGGELRGLAGAGAGAATAAPPAGVKIQAAAARRLVDTRGGEGTAGSRPGPGRPLRFVPVELSVLPARAAGYLLTVTAVGAAEPGYLTVHPCGWPSSASALSFAGPAATANTVWVAGAGDGSVCLEANVDTDVVIDLQGVGAGSDVGTLDRLDTSPLNLRPAFSPDVHDYIVECPDRAANQLDLAVAPASGQLTLEVAVAKPGGGRLPVSGAPPIRSTLTRRVQLAADEAIVVTAGSEEYWVRCLPPDFPHLTVDRGGRAQPGWYALSTLLPTSSHYAMILDEHGTPVWYQRAGRAVQDLEPQPGGLVATFGVNGAGSWQIRRLDGTITATVQAVGAATDIHDLVTLPSGNHLVITYPRRAGVDLTPLGLGPVGDVYDSHIQELTPRGQVVWEWRSEDHIATAETTFPLVFNGAIDLIHMNAMEVAANGDLVVSARHLDAVVRIERPSGRVVWRLGGNRSDFRFLDDPLGGPARQHDARFTPDGHLTLFDNRSGLAGQAARAVEYELDPAAGTARLVWSHALPDGRNSCCLGTVRRGKAGDAPGSTFIGWGGLFGGGPTVSEVDAAGRHVLDVGLPAGEWSYRAIRVPAFSYDRAELRRSAGLTMPPGD